MTEPHPLDGIVTNTDLIKRGRYGRPYVFAPDHDGPLDYDGKGVKGRREFTRTTTYVDCLDDKSNLDKYHQRNVLAGLVKAPHLFAEAADAIKHSTADEPADDPAVKATLNRIAADARDVFYESRKADTGTAVHHWCEQADLALAKGMPPAAVLASLTDHVVDGHLFHIANHREDVAAYIRATWWRLRPVAVETLTIVDDLGVAGTPDRLVEWIGPPVSTPDGDTVEPGDVLIDDTKTGSVQYGLGKFAMQMACYANGVYYDQATNTRRPLPAKLRRDWAIIVHVPAGQGTAELIWLDIAAGWNAVRDLAGPVRDWRRESRKFGRPFPALTVRQQIDAALTADEVRALWTPEWDADLTAYGAQRAAQIAGKAAAWPRHRKDSHRCQSSATTA